MKSFQFEQFKNVEIEDGPLLTPLLLASEPRTCESNFLNIYVWQPQYATKYQICDGVPYVYLEEEDELLFPAGGGGAYLPPERLAAVSSEMKKHGKNGIFYQTAADYLEKFPDYSRFYTAEQIHEDFGEYLYRIEDLIELRGAKLHKKKNLISQFERLYPDFRISPLTRESIPDCLALCRTWSLLKEEAEPEEIREIEEEHAALERAFAVFDRMDAIGCCVYVGAVLVAFSVCSRVNSEMFTVHFEKNDPKYKGSGQMINREMAGMLCGKALYINREQDLGVEGLRHAKSSYAPVELIRNYSLVPKEGISLL